MKNKTILLFSLLISFGSTVPVQELSSDFDYQCEIVFPSTQAIVQHKESVDHELQVNKVAKYSIRAVSSMILAIATYKMISSWNQSALVIEEGTFENMEMTPKGFSDLKNLVEKLSENMGGLIEKHAALLSMGWWKRIGRTTAEFLIPAFLAQGIYGVTALFGGNIGERVFHDGDLAWFAQSHTKIGITLEEIEQYALSLSMVQDTADRTFKVNRYFFVCAFNDLVHQLEAILGFMHYKIDRMPNQVTQEAQVIAQRILEYMHEVGKNLGEQLQADSLFDVPSLVEGFKNELVVLLNRFGHLEEQE